MQTLELDEIKEFYPNIHTLKEYHPDDKESIIDDLEDFLEQNLAILLESKELWGNDYKFKLECFLASN